MKTKKESASWLVNPVVKKAVVYLSKKLKMTQSEVVNDILLLHLPLDWELVLPKLMVKSLKSKRDALVSNYIESHRSMKPQSIQYTVPEDMNEVDAQSLVSIQHLEKAGYQLLWKINILNRQEWRQVISDKHLLTKQGWTIVENPSPFNKENEQGIRWYYGLEKREDNVTEQD